MSEIEEPAKKPEKRGWKGLSHIAINKKEAMSGFRWSLFYNVINKIILPLLNNAVVLRFLGPAIGGTYSLCYSFFFASDTLRDFGLNQTYMREKDMPPRREAAFMALGILQGVILGSILFALRYPLANYYSKPELAPLLTWVSLGVAVNGFWTIPKAKVLKAGRIRESGAREMIANVLATGLSIWMLFHGYANALCLIFPLFVNCVLNVAITYGLAPVLNFRSDVKSMLNAARASVSTLGASALYNIYIQADNMVIGRLVGVTAVGLYDQGQGIAQKPMQLLSVPMMAPLQAAFSQNSKNPQKLGSMYGRALVAALMFTIPLYAIMLVAAEPATLLILGHKWSGSIPLVRVCCIYFAARTIGTIGGTALVAGGRARFAMISWFFAYATAAIGCLIASRYVGSMEERTIAFAWAFTAGAVVVYTIHTVFAFRWFRIDGEAMAKLRSACLIAFVSCLIFAGIYFLPFGPWIALAIACILGPILHMAIVGWVRERRFFAHMSYEGIKNLYQSL